MEAIFLPFSVSWRRALSPSTYWVPLLLPTPLPTQGDKATLGRHMVPTIALDGEGGGLASSACTNSLAQLGDLTRFCINGTRQVEYRFSTYG